MINFGASAEPVLPGDDPVAEDDAGQRLPRVVIEEGAPSGIRVVEFPNSNKTLAVTTAQVTESGCEEAGKGDAGFRLPPLTSYSDVFGEAGPKKGCWNCGEVCVSGYYESVKQGGSVICAKCFKNENYEESKLAEDFKLTEVDGTGNPETNVWTDAETLLLLEAVTKHGDDWNLVEQHVRTKTKLDCISRLIQLPFGEHMLQTTITNGNDRNSINHMDNFKQTQMAAVAEPQVSVKNEDQQDELLDEPGMEAVEINEGDTGGPPPKRRCVSSFTEAGSSLMKQVALLSTIVGPHVAAAAAEAAVATLCKENPFTREFFEDGEDDAAYNLGFDTMNDESSRAIEVEDTETEAKPKESNALESTIEKKKGPSTSQVRVAIATAMGAAAAHAKLLADQEDREIEHLMATIIETQLKKIQCKSKHFEELELIMEKEYSQIQELKEYILAERINVLQHACNAGISRWKDKPLIARLP